MSDVKYEFAQCWALAHSKGQPGPFITTVTANTRKELIARVERQCCGAGNWRRWSRSSGAKLIRVRIEQGSWP
jgi:hypothetical protein